MNKLSLLLLLLILPGIIFSGTTGKINGRIIDQETGEPLPGVNVFLEGTQIGSSTDMDGFYFILNVKPGTYNLRAEYIGYAPFEIKDVKVRIDLTTTINISLQSEVLMTETVVVVAERPVVTMDISNSQLNIEAEAIESMPIQTVEQALTLQAGIESGSRGIIVRGGGAEQTVFMVDGLSQNDERSNYPYSAVSLSSIEEIQIQTGGFNAEYGQARSGIVNVVTKEGDVSKYSVTATVRYSPAAPKNFGPSLYSANSYFNRPYLDPDVMWTGTDNGAWDEYTRKQYPNFGGWNKVSDDLLADSNPDNDLSPEAAKRLFEWERRRNGNIKDSDYIVDLGFGGPVPFIGKDLGNLRFYISHFRKRDMFVIPLSRDSYSENHTQLKLTSNIDNSKKLIITGLYGEVFSVSPYSWTTTPTGYLLSGVSTVANYASSASAIYMPGYYSPGAIYRHMWGAKFTNTLDTKTFYEVRAQFKYSKNDVWQIRDRDQTNKYEIVPGYFVDESPYGYNGYSVFGIDGTSLGGWMNLGRDSTINMTYTLGFDYTRQMDNHNQLKSGIEFVFNDFDVKSTTYSPSMSTWTRSMIYNIFPYRVGAYVQNKMEFEGFIANLGLRFDYSNSNTDVFDLGTYDKNYTAGYGNELEENVNKNTSKGIFTISPRLGVSHPISENSKLYFNYGHFRSEPFSSYRFRIQRESNGLVTSIGNPNLDLEKTVAYELGYEQNISDMFLLKLAGYYKDVTNQPGWVYYQNFNQAVQYNKAANNNYADIRGFELTLTKRGGRWVSGFINYTYDVSTSGYFGLLRYYEDPNEQRNYEQLNPSVSKPHPRPYARANIDFHTPDDFGPDYLNVKPLSSWNFNILADWRTGAYETYNPKEEPGVVDNVQWNDWYNVDLRLSKTISFTKFSMQLYMDINNVFNIKYMSEAGFSDAYDRINYLESLRFSWEEGMDKGSDKVGDYRESGYDYEALELNPDNDPEIKKRNDWRIKHKTYIDMPNIKALTFLNPRDIWFGVRFNF